MHSARILRLPVAALLAALVGSGPLTSVAAADTGASQARLEAVFASAYDGQRDALRPSAMDAMPFARSTSSRMWMVHKGPGQRLVREAPDSGAVLGIVRPGSHVYALWSFDQAGHHYLAVQWEGQVAFIEDDAHAWTPRLATNPMRYWGSKTPVRAQPGAGAVLATIAYRQILGLGQKVTVGGKTYHKVAVGVGGSQHGYVVVSTSWRQPDWRPAPPQSRMTASLDSSVRHASRSSRSRRSYLGDGDWCSRRLVNFGRELQRRGFRVSEHPAFGGVDARHSRTGGHHQGCAIDVNRYNGTSAREQRALWPVVREAQALGLSTIFMSPKYGHYGHAHINVLQRHWLSHAVRYGTPR